MFASPWRSSHCSKGPLDDAYVFGRAVSCPWLQKSWRVWLRWETKPNKMKQTNQTALCWSWQLQKNGRWEDTAVTEFPMEANDSSERGIQSWNQEPRAMDRRTALRDNCLREGHSCPRHCFWIKEAELTSFLAKLSLPTGSITDGRELPISSCPLGHKQLQTLPIIPTQACFSLSLGIQHGLAKNLLTAPEVRLVLAVAHCMEPWESTWVLES